MKTKLEDNTNNILFEPIKINCLEVKNRIFMPAMHLNMCKDFGITDRLINFYSKRAQGGAGAITLGYATVDELSGGPNCIGAHHDRFIPGLARAVKAIKDNNALAFVQINHAGRYAPSSKIKKQPVAPSAIASRLTGETPKALTFDEIDQVIQRFAKAALRVKQAGFDGVEVLSGTGYLISEFLSPLTNRREDEYGKTFENRMRFGLKIIKEIKKKVGPAFPIIVRINGNDFMSGGNTREELKSYAVKLADAGADALNINVGWHEARVPQIVASVPRAVFVYLARGVKSLVDIPVIAGHRINTPDIAREVIENEMCDMAAMGRALLADPDLPDKALTGRSEEIIHCIGCAQGCFDHVQTGKPVECLVNPLAGHENKYIFKKTKKPKRIMIIGAGAAGMSAALSAAASGHDVSLYEKTDQTGGQLFLAAAPPGREEFMEFAKDLNNQLIVNGIETKFNQEIDLSFIIKEKPEKVILATGAVPFSPPIKGSDLPHVVQGWDVLGNRVRTGRRVVVIGAGAVGVETALYLAKKGALSADDVKFLIVNRAEDPEFISEQASKGSKEVVLIEMTDKIGRDIGISTRWTMIQELSRCNVQVHTSTMAKSINKSGVSTEKEGKSYEIEADTIVMAVGSQPYNPLEKGLREQGIPYEVIGDAGKIGMAFDAVHSGFAAGYNL